MPTGECRPDASSRMEPRPGAAPRTPSGRQRSGRRPDGGPGCRSDAVEAAVVQPAFCGRRQDGGRFDVGPTPT